MIAYLALALGVCLVAAGVAVIYWPAALIVAGVVLIAVGLLIDTDKRGRSRT